MGNMHVLAGSHIPRISVAVVSLRIRSQDKISLNIQQATEAGTVVVDKQQVSFSQC